MKLKIVGDGHWLNSKKKVILYKKKLLGIFSCWEKLPILNYRYYLDKGIVWRIEDNAFYGQDKAESWVKDMFTGTYPKFKSGEEYMDKYRDLYLDQKRLDAKKKREKIARELEEKRTINV